MLRISHRLFLPIYSSFGTQTTNWSFMGNKNYYIHLYSRIIHIKNLQMVHILQDFKSSLQEIVIRYKLLFWVVQVELLIVTN